MPVDPLLPVANLPWVKRWHDLVEHIHLSHTEADVDQLINGLSSPAQPRTLAFVNAHAMNCSVADTCFHESLMAADHLLRDGSGMAILLRSLHRAPGINLNGTDLIPRLIARFAGAHIALLGTQEPFLSAADARIHAQLAPGSTSSTANGFLADNEYLQIARREKPALIVLGMGMPKQERVAALLRQQLDHPCLIVCGGAILDFLGGKVQRAPAWARHLGIEWMYRLLREPRRLFRRYVIGNPVFLARAARFALQRGLAANTGR